MIPKANVHFKIFNNNGKNDYTLYINMNIIDKRS